jgi:hypothetical protein
MTALPRIALALALVLPAAALAEGAVRVFDCLADDGTATRFTLTPVAVDAAGKGAIRVTRDGQTFSGRAASDHGPFQFGTDTDNFTLLVDDATADGQLRLRLHHVAVMDSTETPFAITLTPFTCETDI